MNFEKAFTSALGKTSLDDDERTEVLELFRSMLQRYEHPEEMKVQLAELSDSPGDGYVFALPPDWGQQSIRQTAALIEREFDDATVVVGVGRLRGNIQVDELSDKDIRNVDRIS